MAPDPRSVRRRCGARAAVGAVASLLVTALALSGPLPTPARATALTTAGPIRTTRTPPATVSPTTPATPANPGTPGVYLVTLAPPPAAAYPGGRPGLARTRPRPGVRFDRSRPAVRAYSAWLMHRQERVLSGVGHSRTRGVLYHYTTALDGFAALLTAEQVRALQADPDVVRVEHSRIEHVDGLRHSRDAEDRAAPQPVGPAGAGRGVVVGVVDSGIWPDNPSFHGLTTPTAGTAHDLPGFHGSCVAAQRWSPEDCSQKIVSARWFVRGYGESDPASSEFRSARDGTGHGSHVASVAVGDRGVRVRIDGQHFGTVSGLAPAARLAVYKACWAGPEPSRDGCSTADTVAAVDRAVADGVDVLTYSVSGGRTLQETVERAFLGAGQAGVVVVAAAGNTGPRAGSVDHVAPWVTTVAASRRTTYAGAVRLGNGTELLGTMVSDRAVPSSPLVLGADAGTSAATRRAAAHCERGSLDADAVQGAVVVCRRGDGPRVDKSATVADAGGAAMVLADTEAGQGTDADVHSLPTVHLDVAAAARLGAYARRAGGSATARLDPDAGHADSPSVAGFSARGPVSPARGGALKPDLVAPGFALLGAVAPASDSGRSWNLMTGTSTSAPVVAGVAARILGEHPGWSPARVRSTLTTTARPLARAADDARTAGPAAAGAGLVDARRALDPGLVLDATDDAWPRVLAGDESVTDVNAASVVVPRLTHPVTAVRRLTNVGGATESYAARVSGLRGVDVQAFPATIRLTPGQSVSVRLRVSARPSAPDGRPVGGYLTWRGSQHTVRMPVLATPTR